MTNPVTVEVLRGEAVESRHRGAISIVDAAGKTVFSLGDVEKPIFPRSAIKALQALPLVESGIADRLGLTAQEISLACSSHSGEPIHVETALSMLKKAGKDADCLECGAHWPLQAKSRRRSTIIARGSIQVLSAFPAALTRIRRDISDQNTVFSAKFGLLARK